MGMLGLLKHTKEIPFLWQYVLDKGICLAAAGNGAKLFNFVIMIWKNKALSVGSERAFYL